MEPIRTCVLTKTKASKKKLIRLVKNDKGKFVIDERQIVQKRGIYIFPCEKILNIITKQKKYDIDEKLIEKIIEIIKVGGMDE